mmetsp:Transcript_78166/g.126759  ORF Transcript_78166/g.126759 Transcript_78166/m.126759 type:complete len:169 (+) Transcript_78166:107-613(+)
MAPFRAWWACDHSRPAPDDCESRAATVVGRQGSIARRGCRTMAGNVGCVSTMVVFLVAVMHAQSVHADDTWEVWSTKPDGTNELQDALLIQGHLRHTVTQNDFEAFKNVLSSQGCSAGSAPAKCEVLLHHGDPNGRTIYHLIGKLGLGGDYVAASDVASNNVTGFFFC